MTRRSALAAAVAACLLAGTAWAEECDLHEAARAGEVAAVSGMISGGADLDGLCNGLSALTRAAETGQIGAARLLLQSGADMAAGEDGVPTAMVFAIFGGHPAVVAALLEHGASAGRTPTGLAPLHIAASIATLDRPDENWVERQLEIARLLVEAGVDVNAREADGTPAVLYAAAGPTADRAVPMLEFLLAQGADPNLAGTDGHTALMSAALQVPGGAVRLLLAAGADPNARTLAGVTALMRAASQGRVEPAIALLEAGADASLKDAEGRTALDRAEYTGYLNDPRIVDILSAK